MRAMVKKWGNSASVRIPSALLEAAHLKLDQPVEIREEKGRIIIEAIGPETCNIDELVARITDENMHDYIDTGAPMGLEFW